MTATTNRTICVALATVWLSVALGGAAHGAPAGAAQLNQLAYASTGLEGHPDLGGGGVVDVTLGRELGAHELHRVVGAAPSTTYVVVSEIYFATACEPTDPFGPVIVEEGPLQTNTSGAGTFAVRFPAEALDGAPDEFWVRWQLLDGDEPAYATSCAHIVIRS